MTGFIISALQLFAIFPLNKLEIDFTVLYLAYRKRDGMVENRVSEIISFFENKLIESGLNISQVVLFGSAYRGEMTKDSDLDIAVVSDDFRNKTIFERARLAGKAVWDTTKKYEVALDVVKLTIDEFENETRMVASYVKEGREKYSIN